MHGRCIGRRWLGGVIRVMQWLSGLDRMDRGGLALTALLDSGVKGIVVRGSERYMVVG